MEKKADCYILYHKKVDYDLWDNEVWTPLEVGAATREKLYDFGRRDNEGENISDWNGLFAELTGIYWIWKHLEGHKYAGQVQYRRRYSGLDTISDLDRAFREHKVIAVAPLRLNVPLRLQYGACHYITDIDRAGRIVKRLYPEYGDSWDKYIENGYEIHYSNGFIMLEEDYKMYCEWLFSILDEYTKEMGWESVENVRDTVAAEIICKKRRNSDGNGKTTDAIRYQTQIYGFLSERLFTLYLKHNYKREEVLLLPYYKMENCL